MTTSCSPFGSVASLNGGKCTGLSGVGVGGVVGKAWADRGTGGRVDRSRPTTATTARPVTAPPRPSRASRRSRPRSPRSEEHTSELQSRLHLVCRLLLEKKKKKKIADSKVFNGIIRAATTRCRRYYTC